MAIRRTSALVAGFLLLLSALPATAAPSPSAPTPTSADSPLFKDVGPGHWAYTAVQTMAKAGILSPDPQGLFRPDSPVRRAELFKMILGARRKDAGNECQGMFKDVPCSSWYAPVAETAYRMAIADGIGTDLFGPDEYVNRQQLFTILIRAVGRRWEAQTQGWSTVTSRLQRFTDRGEISDWARASLALAAADQIANGYADGTFRPNASATRAEAVALISRVVLPADGLQTVKLDGRTISFQQSLDMSATMYATGEAGVGVTTYTGISVRVGAVAVDPKVVPLGKLLYVEGYGYAVAADIGGAIKGNRIDLFTWSYQDAVNSGRRSAKIWVLP